MTDSNSLNGENPVTNLKQFFNKEYIWEQFQKINTVQAPKYEGFVGLFDILGFQSLVKDNDLEKVMLTFEQVNGLIRPDIFNDILEKDLIRVQNYSDTFLIYTTDATPQSFRIFLLLSQLLFTSAYGHDLPIRGSTAVGQFYATENVIVGIPVVKAYQHEINQNWIGCWITQPCVDRIGYKELTWHIDNKNIVHYPIPLKSGEVLSHYALNWTSILAKSLDKERLKNWGFLKRKDGHSWSEEIKHRNTKDFIDFVLA